MRFLKRTKKLILLSMIIMATMSFNACGGRGAASKTAENQEQPGEIVNVWKR